MRPGVVLLQAILTTGPDNILNFYAISSGRLCLIHVLKSAALYCERLDRVKCIFSHFGTLEGYEAAGPTMYVLTHSNPNEFLCICLVESIVRYVCARLSEQKVKLGPGNCRTLSSSGHRVAGFHFVFVTLNMFHIVSELKDEA